MDPGFITCDDIGKLLFVIFWKHLKQLFGHFNPLPLLFVIQQIWHPSSRNLSDFQMLLQNKGNRWKWYAYLSCNITNCKSIWHLLQWLPLFWKRFLYEMQILAYLISVHFWWTLHQTQISFSTAELCHKTHKKVQKQ